MAVVNEWINTEVEAGKLGNPSKIMHGRIFAFATTFEIAAGDSDGSTYKIANLKSNMVPKEIKLNCDALTSSTDWDLGFYTEAGIEVDENILMDATDISTGYAVGSEINCLSALAIANIGKKIWELLGKTVANKDDAYVLTLTGQTIGSDAGTISLRGEFIQG